MRIGFRGWKSFFFLLTGKISMFWAGMTPRLVVMDPELMKEILSNKLGHFGKPPLNPLILILSKGLACQEGEGWARHRRIINPAFHLEKLLYFVSNTLNLTNLICLITDIIDCRALIHPIIASVLNYSWKFLLKRMLPAFSISCSKMIEQWKKMVNHQESCEVDVWPELQNLTMDIISRAAFGSNYEEGKRLFELHKELIFFGFGSYADLVHSRFQVLITSLRC